MLAWKNGCKWDDDESDKDDSVKLKISLECLS